MSPAAGHIMTGNLKIISHSGIRYIVCKGPKYWFPSRIDLKQRREGIASALNDFGNRWCKREYVEPNALKEWKVSILKIVDQRIKFYSQNTNLFKPPSIFILTVPRRYFCCGSLLLLVLDVCIYTLVQLLC